MTQHPASPPVTEAIVMEALSRVKDPEIGRDVVTLGMIQGLRVEGSKVDFTLVLTTPACPVRSQFEEAVREAVRRIPGVEEVNVRMDANVRSTTSGQPPGGNLLPSVRNIVAVGAGKGGVGKSTVAVNLALALAQQGAKVGLLDADVYGPNVPLMTGVSAPGPSTADGIAPAENFGIKIMSMGFFLPQDAPVVWRGPMLHGAIQQMLKDVAWGDLDYLVVDLPPGTGDVSLTLAQSVPLTGAVVVITPQEVALQDGIKAIGMFRKLNVPVLGLIENMSYFVCPHCEGEVDLFGHGGGKSASQRHNVDFLGEVPIDVQIRVGGDTGQPVTVAFPDSATARTFREIASLLAGRISVRNMGEPVGVGASAPITFLRSAPKSG